MISRSKVLNTLTTQKDRLREDAAFLLRSSVFWCNSLLRKNKEVLWLIGDGRSGTTWVSDLINRNRDYRELFEPFHPVYINAMKCIARHQYVRPDLKDTPLYDISSKVFRGTFIHRRLDNNNHKLIYNKLLIKDIFANLFAFWAACNFPHIKIVLLIRNPFAVALSKYKVKEWPWMNNPKKFLGQKELCEDYLNPFEDMIQNIGDDFIERQILIWSIIHYIPLLQFNKQNLCIIFYEDFFRDPKKELLRIAEFKNSDDRKDIQNISPELYAKPSKVSGSESNIVTGKSPVNSWKKEISAKQIGKGFKILNRFGMDQLYDEDVNPDRRVVENLLAR